MIPFKCVATLRRGHKPRFWRSTKSKKRKCVHCSACSGALNTGQASKGSARDTTECKNHREAVNASGRKEAKTDKHITIQMENEKQKTAKWNERQENRILRWSRSHCAAASQSNKGNRENGKQSEKWGRNAGIRGAMRRAGGFEREQVNVSQPLMMPEPF